MKPPLQCKLGEFMRGELWSTIGPNTFLCTISFLNTVRALGENSRSIISKFIQVVEVKELNVYGSLLVSSNLITSCIIIYFILSLLQGRTALADCVELKQ